MAGRAINWPDKTPDAKLAGIAARLRRAPQSPRPAKAKASSTIVPGSGTSVPNARRSPNARYSLAGAPESATGP